MNEEEILMSAVVKENLLVSHFLAFFIVHSIQVGVGILGFQRYIAEKAGYDGWISVLLAAVVIHFIIWILYKLLRDRPYDIMMIHEELFGKWLGKLFSTLFFIYFIAFALTVMRTYIEVIQVWLFPKLNIWIFSFVFLSLIYYVVSGGFRIVVGICFLGVILPQFLLLSLLFPLKYADFTNLLPIIDHSLSSIIGATKQMTLSYLGFEILLICYPFIKKGPQSQKWVHFGAAFTTFIYLAIALVSFGFYSEGQLAQTIWPTLTLWKIVSLPFLERFEYIGISIWAIVILPNVCLALWAVSRIGKSLFSIKQRTVLMLTLIVVYLANNFISSRDQIDMLNHYLSTVGFYLIYGYIPLLYVLQVIIHKARKKA
jgi:spore germination protein (amino acid permease)